VRFRFVSEQFVFEEGEVSTLRDFAFHGASARAPQRVAVKCDQTDEVANVIRGENLLVFNNCLVRSKRSNMTLRIPVFQLTTWVTDAEIAAGLAQVVVGFHAFVRVVAVDVKDQPLVREHVVGIAFAEMSIEAKVPERSPLIVLLPPGEYVAYLPGPNRIYAPFEVHPGQEDVGTIRLCGSIGDSPATNPDRDV
jgi:hypothetical protein